MIEYTGLDRFYILALIFLASIYSWFKIKIQKILKVGILGLPGMA